MLHIPSLGLVYVPINKNATNSLTEALVNCGYEMEELGHRHRPPKGAISVAMWRDPHERMESSFRMLGSPEAEFSAWVLKTCGRDVIADRHYRPQADFCELDGLWFVDHVIPWDFDEFARIFRTGPIAHRHAGTERTIEWTPEARIAFEHRYERDLREWRYPSRIYEFGSGSASP